VIQILFFALVIASTFISLTDWRKGLFLMIFVGALQDPIRKMMDGAPSYMVLAFVPIWLAICVNVLFSGRQVWLRFAIVAPSLISAIWFLEFALILAFGVLLYNYGFNAFLVGLIGAMGYVFPILAIAVGYHYVRRPSDFILLVKIYSAITAVLLTGTLFEYWGLFSDWSAIGTDALGTTWFRQWPGHIVYMISGFYRSPDLMGWHAAMLVMFSLIMAMRTRTIQSRALWGGLVIWGATMLLLSGRNKMIFMPLVFLGVFGLVQLYKGNIGRTLKIASIAFVCLGLFLTVKDQLSLPEELMLYTEKGSDEATHRLFYGSARSLYDTYDQSGFFGEGLGTATTGARYGGKSSKIRTWQENGVSKILVELGVIGLLAGAFLVATITRSLWMQLQVMPRAAPEFLMFTGLVAIIAANFASFLISHQAFGDPFLVTLIGLLLGVLRSAVRWPR